LGRGEGEGERLKTERALLVNICKTNTKQTPTQKQAGAAVCALCASLPPLPSPHPPAGPLFSKGKCQRKA